MGSARSRRLLYGLSGALALILAAGLLYVISIVAASRVTCRGGYDGTGLDTDVSWWPPGENCGTQSDPRVIESISWSPTAILTLMGMACLVTTLSVALEIRALRRRASEAPPPNVPESPL